MVDIEYKAYDPEIEVDGVKRIEIIPFSTILKKLTEKFESEGLMRKDFSDPVMRSIQYFGYLGKADSLTQVK